MNNEHKELIMEVVKHILRNPEAEEIASVLVERGPLTVSEITKNASNPTKIQEAMNKGVIKEIYDNSTIKYTFNLEYCNYCLYNDIILLYIRQNVGENAFIVASFIVNSPESIESIQKKSGLSLAKVSSEFMKLCKLRFLIPESKDKANQKQIKKKKYLEGASLDKNNPHKLNTLQVIFDIRALHIYSFMMKKIGFHAATLVFAMIKDSLLSFTLSHCIDAAKDLLTLESEEVHYILEEIALEERYMKKEGSEIYKINIEQIVKEIQEDQVADLVKLKYGTEHRRVYKVITAKGTSTADELLKWILLPIDRAKEIIEEFLKNGILQNTEDDKLVINFYELKERFVRLLYITAANLLAKKREIEADKPEIVQIDKALKEIYNHLLILTEF